MPRIARKVQTPLLFVSLSVSLFATEKTWTGKISDSQCGATHRNAMTQQHEQEIGIPGGGKVSARDCTLACVKNGASYTMVNESDGSFHRWG
jgi:hypothetical protein